MEELTLREWLEIALRQPEYWHAMLHPLPVYGVAFGWLATVLAVLLRSRKAELVGVLLIFAGALGAWPVSEFGHEAYDRILTLSDDDGRAWLDTHRGRAERVLPLYYTLAALAAAAALVPRWWPRWRWPLLGLVMVGAMAAMAAGGWIASAGGQVRHKEFRYAPPPGKPDEPRPFSR